ncbi:hypothetical protein [Kordiimonas sp.]|uniref:hypothetical protein n=1 Tax=Kordiimonas sp. TaxID=1970157 RepID=UPI003A926144
MIDLPPSPNRPGFDPAVWKADALIVRRVELHIEPDRQHAEIIGSLGVRTIHESTGDEFYSVPKPDPLGVGTTIAVSLARIGIKPKFGCKCKHRAAIMDRLGIDWAKSHIPHVESWLIEAAEDRGKLSAAAARFGGAAAVVGIAIAKIESRRLLQGALQ